MSKSYYDSPSNSPVSSIPSRVTSAAGERLVAANEYQNHSTAFPPDQEYSTDQRYTPDINKNPASYLSGRFERDWYQNHQFTPYYESKPPERPIMSRESSSTFQPTKSSLVPTATPFIFEPRPVAPTQLVKSQSYTQDKSEMPSPSLKGVAPDFAIGGPREELREEKRPTGWSFDSRGLLIAGDNRYPIADKSLHIQKTQPFSFFPVRNPPSPQSALASFVATGCREDADRGANPRDTSPFATDSGFWLPPAPVESQANRCSSLEALRSRSSSLGGSSSTSSYGGTYIASYLHQHPAVPLAIHRTHQRSPSNGSSLSFDRASTAQQLLTYFGPSPVEVNSASLNFFAHDVPYPTLPEGSILDSNPLVHLPLGYTYQTDPDDLLYTQARQNFVQESLSTLMANAGANPLSINDPQIVLTRSAMMAHFDQAMHSSTPLATLYGLSVEAARALAADPEMSGISDSVLRLAATRACSFYEIGGGGMDFGAAQGPSANNRKLGLYKTELCRNWEEKGSCRYGSRCQYAHGGQEIRDVSRHPKFKTEVCRTFWQSGSCGYGKRCCFIHTTVPSGALASTSPPDSLAGMFNDYSINDLPDSPPADSGSPRSTRFSSFSTSPVTSRGFGPALANYLEKAPTGKPGSESTRSTAMSNSSSQDKFTEELSTGGLFGIPFGGPPTSTHEPSTSINTLGTKYAQLGNGSMGVGRFTNNPSEVPPQFVDPPQSRLHRLSSRGSISLDKYSPHPFQLVSGSPASVAFSPIANMIPRGMSNSSLATISTSSSSSSIAAQSNSPFGDTRALSSSSLSSSSFGQFTSPDSTLSASPSHAKPTVRLPLLFASNDWLGSGNSRSGANSNSAIPHSPSLDWGEGSDYLLDSDEMNYGAPATSPSVEWNRLHRENIHATLHARADERTPLASQRDQHPSLSSFY